MRIFNTLTKKKENFNSISKKKINIYVCGVTVYDYCHIGHARTFIFFDIVVRYFLHKKYIVNYVRNITDIDDKIIQKSKLNNEKISDLTYRMIHAMNQDFLNLGLLTPTFQPCITEYIDIIISIIQDLLKNNHAYFLKNGDIVFSVNSFKNYGLLSKQRLNKLKLNHKFKHKNLKNLNHDFVLWKNLDKNNFPTWKSPWGFGRPGWHIECSAINHSFFNKNLDIHGGGLDLLFPHHENERAQSSCLYHQDNYGNYWMHVGSLLVNNKKMSKSLNNTIFIKDLLKKYDSEIIRYFLLSTHYRKPLNYNENNLKKSIFALKKIYMIFKNMICINNLNYNQCLLKYQYFCKDFYDAMNNDFNTPQAISILFSIVKKINIFLKDNKMQLAIQLSWQLKYLANILGLLNHNPIDFLNQVN